MAIDQKGKRFAAKIPAGVPEHMTTAPNRALKRALQAEARREGNASKGTRKRTRGAKKAAGGKVRTVAKAATRAPAPAVAVTEGTK